MVELANEAATMEALAKVDALTTLPLPEPTDDPEDTLRADTAAAKGAMDCSLLEADSWRALPL